MIRSRVQDIDPLKEIRCIRDEYAKRFKTIEEYHAHLDKTLSPEKFLAKSASGEITEEDIRISDPVDEFELIEKMKHHRKHLIEKYPLTEDFFNYLDTVPTAEQLLAELE
ncbi:MAG: hypothetical protein LBE12_10535 [Planctomycetaceae bacterium]|jgi:phosphoribosylamine-glycine ligase|nr:hypothetical protein [Planctomycetaceae bacterium]